MRVIRLCCVLAFVLVAVSLLAVALPPCVASNMVYVDGANGADSNDGFSWGSAKKTVQGGLDAALPSDEVWVAAGTYTPTSGTDRLASVVLKAGVAVYGGFSCLETDREQRDWIVNQTLISGDIGVTGDSSDNSYHVIVGCNAPCWMALPSQEEMRTALRS